MEHFHGVHISWVITPLAFQSILMRQVPVIDKRDMLVMWNQS